MTDEAFGDLDIQDLLIEGKGLSGSVRDALLGADLQRSADGCPTLTIKLADPHKGLLKSGLWEYAITTQFGPYGFQLAQVKKSGTEMTCVFEELAVARLRANTTPRKVAAGAMTRAQFVQALVKESPGISFVDLSGPAEVTKDEMARGTVLDLESTPQQVAAAQRRIDKGEAEDTWEATGRLADQVGRRRFIRGPREFVYASDEILAAQPVSMRLNEETDGVVDINFDWDVGKPQATATIRCYANRWFSAPGAHVELTDLGPASGTGWLVADIQRSVFSSLATIKVAKPKPELAEPESGTSDITAGEGEIQFPYDTEPFTSGTGFAWPLDQAEHIVTSEFGMRRSGVGTSRMHLGIDLKAEVHTVVLAAKAGTVIRDGDDPTGWGWWLMIQHGDDTRTLYAHLSYKDVGYGEPVTTGQPIGLSGGEEGAPGAGNSSGPHLHFEVHVAGRQVDPRRYLPA